MSVLFIGKRFYTNRDALGEKYGRIWQLPWHWSGSGIVTSLWLVDYHTCEIVHATDGALQIDSTPVKNLALFRHWLSGCFIKGDKPDVVVASGDCYIGWLGLRIARRLHARFVFDVYDKYDEFSGYRSPPGFDLFGYLLAKADVRLFASRVLMEHERGRSSVLVPNGIDTENFKAMDKTACRREIGLSQNSVYVGYVGSMSVDRGAADLVGAVQLLRDDGMDARVLLAGRMDHGHAQWPPFVTYLGNVPYARVPVVMGCCDVLALPYRNSAYLDMASSCKIAEYITARRPIAATRTSNFTENFPTAAEDLVELLAIPSDTVDFARVISEQLKKPRLVALPPSMSWCDIAMETARKLALS